MRKLTFMKKKGTPAGVNILVGFCLLGFLVAGGVLFGTTALSAQEMDFKQKENDRMLQDEEVRIELLILYDAQQIYKQKNGRYFRSNDKKAIESTLKVKLQEEWRYTVSDSPVVDVDALDPNHKRGWAIDDGKVRCIYGECAYYHEEDESKGDSQGKREVTSSFWSTHLGGTYAQAHASPAVANLDDSDPEVEIAVGLNFNGPDFFFYILDHEGTVRSTVLAESDIEASPAIGDIDADGDLEIVVGTIYGDIFAIEANGTSTSVVDLWPADFHASPVLVNLDDDEELEIIATTRDSGMYIFNHDGSPLSGLPDGLLFSTVNPSTGFLEASPAAVDVNYDGELEIFAADTEGYLYGFQFDGMNWVQMFSLLAPIAADDIQSSLAVADIDGDTRFEIVFASKDDKLYVCDADDGTLLWDRTLADPITTSPLIANVIRHTFAPTSSPLPLETFEIVVITEEGQVQAFDHDGGPPLWSTQIIDPSNSAITSSPVAVDIDNDGELEIVVATRGGNLHALNHDGSLVGQLNDESMDMISFTTPVLTDLDEDSNDDLEVLIGDNDGYLHAWELTGALDYGTMSWPKFRRDLENTGACPLLLLDNFDDPEFDEEKWTVIDRAIVDNGTAVFEGDGTVRRIDSITGRKNYRRGKNLLFEVEFSFDDPSPGFSIGLTGGRPRSSHLYRKIGLTAGNGEFYVSVGREFGPDRGGETFNVVRGRLADPTSTPNFPTLVPGDVYTAVFHFLGDVPGANERVDVYLYRNSAGFQGANSLVATWDSSSHLLGGANCSNEMEWDPRISMGTYISNGKSYVNSVKIYGLPEAELLQNVPEVTYSGQIHHVWPNQNISFYVPGSFDPGEEDYDIEPYPGPGGFGGDLPDDTIFTCHIHQPSGAVGAYENGYFSWTPTTVHKGVNDFTWRLYHDSGLMDAVKIRIVVLGTCFLEGTSISMANGTIKPIEEIKVGDMVLSVDEENKTVTNKVTGLFVHPETKGYLLVETAAGRQLRVTKDHRVYSGGEYKQIGMLTIDSPLTLLQDGKLVETRITSMRKVNTTQTVYNFEVENSHTYFAEGYLVHNRKPDVQVMPAERND
ncbi:PQQ-binding-like beta-propeller repeat protein [Candidatus Omnitrophota bacterium]